jgi:hypothetical protein
LATLKPLAAANSVTRLRCMSAGRSDAVTWCGDVVKEEAFMVCTELMWFQNETI